MRRFLPHSCSASGVATVGIGFAFAAAMDNDKRLLEVMEGYNVAEINGNEVSRAHDDEWNSLAVPPVHPYPVLHSQRTCERVVVGGGGKSED